MQAREQEVNTAQQLFEDNQKQVQIGSLAEIEVTRAESQLYAAQAGPGDFADQSAAAGDHSEERAEPRGRGHVRTWPRSTSFRSTRCRFPRRTKSSRWTSWWRRRSSKRVEIEQSRINLESNKLNLVGIKNSLQAHAAGVRGTDQQRFDAAISPRSGARRAGVGYLAGGYGNAAGADLPRRNYPNYSAGFSLNIPLRNRAAQSDYVTSLIEMRQNELSLQKSINQVRVDVQNAVIGLQQARARYEPRCKARMLQEADVEGRPAEVLALGASTAYQVVQDQRDLANAQSSEVQAMANYSHARIAFDQALGTHARGESHLDRRSQERASRRAR